MRTLIRRFVSTARAALAAALTAALTPNGATTAAFAAMFTGLWGALGPSWALVYCGHVAFASLAYTRVRGGGP